MTTEFEFELEFEFLLTGSEIDQPLIDLIREVFYEMWDDDDDSDSYEVNENSRCKKRKRKA